MATAVTTERYGAGGIPWYAWTRLRMNRNFLGFWFMLPAAIFLLFS